MSINVYRQETLVSQKEREQLKGHRSFVIWFTGLSGSGKSTLAAHLHKTLISKGIHSYMLDGDNIRLGINADLDFTEDGRVENIRRIAEIAKLFVDAGEVVLSSFISPFAEDRENAKRIIGPENFIEVYVECPLDECEKRDVKGLYAKARSGEIKRFTGIDSPYEAPVNPDIVVKSNEKSIEDCTTEIYNRIKNKLK